MTKAFTIAIAGRPNVGKSTLFNRLVGKSMAIVDDRPGVTRDWRDGEGSLFDLHFKLFDTAGLEQARPKGSLASRTAERTKEALARADVLFMMVDGQAGLTDEDKTVAQELRKADRPMILLVNKCEGPKLPEGFYESLSLGLDHVVALSAKHGENLNELYETLKPYAPKNALRKEKRKREKEETEDEEDRALHIAIVGRPNAGKSTLLNALIGEERMLTGPEAGLTRDAIHVGWDYEGQRIRLVDTAGMRKRARIDEKLEKMSVQESLRAIRLAHVVILVLDAGQPFDKQDYAIAQHVEQEGRALVIAVNKWDNVKERTATKRLIQAKVEASLAQLAGVELVSLSALKKDGLNTLMKAVIKTYETWNKRVPTAQLNRWFEEMMASHPPPIVGGFRIKPRYITQMKSRPPTFVMAGNKLSDLPDSYLRFLTNGLRRAFGFEGVPIRWIRKNATNPFVDGKKKK